MLRHAIASLFAVTLFATTAAAGPLGFATDTSLNLYSVDFATGTATLIGPEGGGFLEALAVSPSGQLYGTDSGGDLYSLDTSTGTATLIGSTGLGNIEGLDFSGSTLVATNFNNPTSFYSIDTSTGAATLITSGSTGLVRTMAILDASTALVLSDSPVSQTLASVDLTTGAVGNIGSPSAFMASMDIAPDGTLYGLGADGAVYTIDPLTGQTTLIGDTGDHFWLGLAIPGAVPEPASLLLLGTGLVAGMRRFRRLRA